MQDHQILVDALHNTVARLRSEEVKYQWGHMGQCNAGHLVQSLTGMSDVEIVESVDNKLDEWTEHARNFCANSGSVVDDLFYTLADYGLDYQAIIHLENLSDSDVLHNLQGGFRYLQKNDKNDVIAYMESMADLFAEKS